MKTILVLINFSKKSEHAAFTALSIAQRTHADLLLYHIIEVPEIIQDYQVGVWPAEDYTSVYNSSEKDLKKLASRMLRLAGKQGNNAFMPVIRCHTDMGYPNQNLEPVVLKSHAELIVAGAKGTDKLEHFLFGSSAETLLGQAPCPLLFVPEDVTVSGIEKIVLASDRLAINPETGRFLSELSSALNAGIVITTVSAGNLPEDSRQNQEQLLQVFPAEIRSRITFRNLQGKQTPPVLSELAGKDHTSLLAVIHRERTLLGSLFHNSTSKKLMNYPVPLLVIPEHLN